MTPWSTKPGRVLLIVVGVVVVTVVTAIVAFFVIAPTPPFPPKGYGKDLIAKVPDFSYLEASGDLSLYFFRDRLMSIHFVPPDPAKYWVD